MSKELASYVQNKLNITGIFIRWSEKYNCFFLLCGQGDEKKAAITNRLTYTEFYQAYKYLINTSPYYIEVMANILSSNVNA